MTDEEAFKLAITDLVVRVVPPDDQVPDWQHLRPRDRMYGWALDRIEAIEARERDEGSRMAKGWRRELQAMRDVKNFIEWYEKEQLERAAAAGSTRRKTT